MVADPSSSPADSVMSLDLPNTCSSEAKPSALQHETDFANTWTNHANEPFVPASCTAARFSADLPFGPAVRHSLAGSWGSLWARGTRGVLSASVSHSVLDSFKSCPCCELFGFIPGKAITREREHYRQHTHLSKHSTVYRASIPPKLLKTWDFYDVWHLTAPRCHKDMQWQAAACHYQKHHCLHFIRCRELCIFFNFTLHVLHSTNIPKASAEFPCAEGQCNLGAFVWQRHFGRGHHIKYGRNWICVDLKCELHLCSNWGQQTQVQISATQETVIPNEKVSPSCFDFHATIYSATNLNGSTDDQCSQSANG